MSDKRFTRKSYSIWDNVENEEFYELHYRYEVDDMCYILNDYEEKVKSLEKENEELKKNCKNYNWYKEYKRLLNENMQLKQYKDAVLNCDSSKIIRVNMNTGEVDLIDKEYSDES